MFCWVMSNISVHELLDLKTGDVLRLDCLVNDRFDCYCK